jgi:hypothetical protein
MVVDHPFAFGPSDAGDSRSADEILRDHQIVSYRMIHDRSGRAIPRWCSDNTMPMKRDGDWCDGYRLAFDGKEVEPIERNQTEAERR